MNKPYQPVSVELAVGVHHLEHGVHVLSDSSVQKNATSGQGRHWLLVLGQHAVTDKHKFCFCFLQHVKKLTFFYIIPQIKNIKMVKQFFFFFFFFFEVKKLKFAWLMKNDLMTGHLLLIPRT